jgi:hypothetical protein
MPWTAPALVFALLALAAGPPAPGTPGQPGKTVAKAKPLGHSPKPFQDIGRTDLFHGYRCGASSCLLHQQGYQWGAEHRIVNPRDCNGTSEEFIEGCLAFAGIDGPLGHREFDPSFPHMVGID